MRRVLTIFILIVFGMFLGIGLSVCARQQIGYSSTPTANRPTNGSKTPTVEVIQEATERTNQNGDLSNVPMTDIAPKLVEQVNQERVLLDLRRLTGEEPICTDTGCYTITDRETNSEGLQWTKRYLYQELNRLGYLTEIQNWARSGYSDQNLIARKPGDVSPEEEIYFVAHTDGVTGSAAADDDASGVVSLLELARVLSNYSFNRTVILLFTTGEEQGALGARSYVDQLSPSELSNIRYVVNVDMVGYDSDHDSAMEFWPGDHPPSLVLAQALSAIVTNNQLDLAPSIVTGCD